MLSSLTDMAQTSLQQVSEKLAINEEEASIILFHIMSSLSAKSCNRKECHFGSKGGVTQWENEVANELRPILQRKSAILEQVANQKETFANEMKEKETRCVLTRLLKGNEDLEENVQDLKTPLQNLLLWLPYRQLSLSNLSNHVAQDKLEEHCPNFAYSLDKNKVGEALQDLPAVALLQSLLSSHFGGRLEASDAESMTIEQFVNSCGEIKTEMMQLAMSFCKAANSLMKLMLTRGKLGNKIKKYIQDKQLEGGAYIFLLCTHTLICYTLRSCEHRLACQHAVSLLSAIRGSCKGLGRSAS